MGSSIALIIHSLDPTRVRWHDAVLGTRGRDLEIAPTDGWVV